MKIGCISSTFPKNHKDSWGVFILDLAQSLTTNNNEVFIITQRYRNSCSHEKLGNVTVSRFPWIYPKTFKRLADYPNIPYLRMISYALSCIYCTVKLIRKYDIHVLYANWVIPSGFLGMIVKKLTNRPLLVHVHGSDINMWLKKPGIAPLVLKTLNMADGIITVNKELAKKINDLGVKTPIKYVIPMGVSLKKIDDISEERKNSVPVIVFVGALRKVKGLEFLIDSIPLIRAEIPHFKLIIAGDGPLRSQLEKTIKKDQLSQHVEFLGQISHHSALQQIKSANIVILPSLSEGTPTVMFEALAFKKPLIASRVGGIPEIITHGETGLLIDPKNASAIANAIIYLLKNKDVGDRLSEQGNKLIKEQYTTEIIAKKIMKILVDIQGNSKVV